MTYYKGYTDYNIIILCPNMRLKNEDLRVLLRDKKHNNYIIFFNVCVLFEIVST